MKTKITILAMLLAIGTFAQTTKTIAVLNMDAKGMIQNSASMGEMVRLELEKTNTYSVMDKYEVADLIAKIKIDSSNCYSKTYLVKAGKALGVDKILSGSAERMGEKIVITLRLIDVATETIEKTVTTEYFNLPEVQQMVEISVKKLFGIKPNEDNADQLIYYDTPIQSKQNTLHLNGPRFGLAHTMGDAGKLIELSKDQGGYGMYPVTFNFGWQQEFEYLSAGHFQALIENIFIIGGVESGRVIPSYTPMMGFRFGKKSYEFGFGPDFRLMRKPSYYYHNTWTNESYYQRGDLYMSTGLVIAAGRTFRSGYLNIPINIYVAPRKDGTTVGFMMGFNILKSKTVK